MQEGHHTGLILEETLGRFFQDEDFRVLGNSLYANVSTFLKDRGHLDPAHTAVEIISDVVWKTRRLVLKGLPISSIQGWLYSCCRRGAIDELRRNKRRPEPTEDQALEHILVGQEQFSGQHVDFEKAELIIEAALERLPRAQRQLVWLDQIEGLAKAEIKKRLRIEADNHYRSLKSKALRALYHEVRALADPIAYERHMKELTKKTDEDE